MDTETHLPPQNEDVERIILSSMILDRDVRSKCLEILIPEMFFNSLTMKIFLTIKYLFEREEPVEISSINEILKRRDISELPYLSALMEDTGSTLSGIDYYNKILKECYMGRKIFEASQKMRALVNSSEPSSFVMSEAERILSEARFTDKEDNLIHISKAMTDAEKEIEDMYHNKQFGISTGIQKLDDQTGGYFRGDLIIIAGRPSMGKTSLAIQAILSASKLGYEVVMFSLEMPRNQIMRRIIGIEGGVNVHSLRIGKLTKEERLPISATVKQASKLPVWIEDSSDITHGQIRARCWPRKDIGLVVIDYLQLMSGEGSNRNEILGNITRSLKKLAKSIDIPVILLSQLSRKNEDSSKVRLPRLSDLRESGAIEQDADMVLFCHREEFYKQTEKNEGKANIIIGKQRNGPAGIFVDCYFEKQFSLFHD